MLAGLLPLAAAAQESPRSVSVPLQIPTAYLQARAADVLDLDASGAGELRADECNFLELEDLRLLPRPDGVAELPPTIGLDIAVRGHGGARLFGSCRGPDPVEGRVLMELAPRAGIEGESVVFDAQSVEFRSSDGSESLLTRPSRALADALLVPRLQDLRVEVGSSLREIDALLEGFLEPEEAGQAVLAAPGQLRAVAVEDGGMRVDLGFELASRVLEAQADESGETPAAPVPEPFDPTDPSWDRVEDALDGFATVVVRYLGPRIDDEELRLELLALLIDVRTEVATMLFEAPAAEAQEDPLRLLFLDTWTRLGAILERLPPGDPEDLDYLLRLSSFIAAGDALALVDELGPAFGVEISRNGLLRLAEILMAGEGPEALTPLPLGEDEVLRSLFGFDGVPEASLATPATEAAPASAWLRRLSPISVAFAEEPDPALLLREVFPRRDNLDIYLGLVARLIDTSLDAHWEESRVPPEQHELFEPLVRATAWKETCWRHYLPGEESDDSAPRVIRSGVGAVGMMQIVGRVWRSLFDLDRLEQDVAYNVAAGIDILDHYYVHYALRRGEDSHPGGRDNLVRATYAAYNGGPSKLSRYRREDVAARARAVDEQFYRQYLVMREETWPRESRCYAR
ncbi:MAG: lytic transglycosylase domain-containing protein [Halieaceae bacterium]|nr:lytic transglycosylase domain-containing protein [Halieaceae bacterium]